MLMIINANIYIYIIMHDIRPKKEGTNISHCALRVFLMSKVFFSCL